MHKTLPQIAVLLLVPVLLFGPETASAFCPNPEKGVSSTLSTQTLYNQQALEGRLMAAVFRPAVLQSAVLFAGLVAFYHGHITHAVPLIFGIASSHNDSHSPTLALEGKDLRQKSQRLFQEWVIDIPALPGAIGLLNGVQNITLQKTTSSEVMALFTLKDKEQLWVDIMALGSVNTRLIVGSTNEVIRRRYSQELLRVILIWLQSRGFTSNHFWVHRDIYPATYAVRSIAFFDRVLQEWSPTEGPPAFTKITEEDGGVRYETQLQRLELPKQGARHERKTNPTMELFTHVGPALPVNQIPWPKERLAPKSRSISSLLYQADVEENKRRVKQLLDLVMERRLLTGVSPSRVQQLVHLLEENGQGSLAIAYSPEAKAKIQAEGSHQNFLSVYFEPHQMVAQLTTDVLRTVDISKEDLLQRIQSSAPPGDLTEKECLIQGIREALNAYALKEGQSIEAILALLPQEIEFQIQKGLDYVEIDQHMSSAHVKIYLPASRIPRPMDRRSQLRFKADMISELRHMATHQSDAQVEPFALLAFVASEGLQAAIDIHLSYKPYSKFARTVIRILKPLTPSDPAELSSLQQAELLSDFIPLIFENLWEALPNHYISHPDIKGGYERLTNPAGYDGVEKIQAAA